MTETWRVVPSLESRYEVCLETGQVRRTHDKKLLKPNKAGCYNSSWGLGYDGGKKRWGRTLRGLLQEVFPFFWIRELHDGEEAAPCHGFPGYYVTTWGRVYNTNKHQWLEFAFSPPYYYEGSLYRDGKKVKCYSHTLVGRTFLSDFQEGLFICHTDETLSYPEINHPDNLWVGTSAENNQDRARKGRNGTRRG